MGYAKPTVARLVDQRARRRATQALVEAHRDEFTTLYELHRRAATVEAGRLAEKVAETHPSPEPPRLMPGVRKPDEDVLDRIDVARCRHCVSSHDRGHVCPKCGARPGGLVSPDSVRSMAEQGMAVTEIAGVTGLATMTVRRVLEGRVATA